MILREIISGGKKISNQLKKGNITRNSVNIFLQDNNLSRYIYEKPEPDQYLSSKKEEIQILKTQNFNIRDLQEKLINKI